MAAIPAEEKTIKNLDLGKLPIERALGQQWNSDADTFGVKTSPPSAQPGIDTRRGCLSTLSSIFDPLGIIGPVLLPAKRVLQKTWQLKLLWDEKLLEDLLKDWNKWKEKLTLLNHVTIPEIRDASQPCQWRHCPGSLNPADEAPRGIPAQRFLTSERRFKGPAFLMKLEEDWSCFEILVLPEDDKLQKNTTKN